MSPLRDCWTRGTIGLFLEAPYQARAGWSLVAGAPMPEMVYEGAAALTRSSLNAKLDRKLDPEIVELGPPTRLR